MFFYLIGQDATHCASFLKSSQLFWGIAFSICILESARQVKRSLVWIFIEIALRLYIRIKRINVFSRLGLPKNIVYSLFCILLWSFAIFFIIFFLGSSGYFIVSAVIENGIRVICQSVIASEEKSYWILYVDFKFNLILFVLRAFQWILWHSLRLVIVLCANSDSRVSPGPRYKHDFVLFPHCTSLYIHYSVEC